MPELKTKGSSDTKGLVSMGESGSKGLIWSNIGQTFLWGILTLVVTISPAVAVGLFQRKTSFVEAFGTQLASSETYMMAFALILSGLVEMLLNMKNYKKSDLVWILGSLFLMALPNGLAWLYLNGHLDGLSAYINTEASLWTAFLNASVSRYLAIRGTS